MIRLTRVQSVDELPYLSLLSILYRVLQVLSFNNNCILNLSIERKLDSDIEFLL